MSLIKSTHIAFAFVACLGPTTALSEKATMTYESAVALTMLDPETAGFDCAFDDLPAKATLTEDTYATAIVNFPDVLAGPRISPTITVRRGVDWTRESIDDTPIGFQAAFVGNNTPEPLATLDDWDMRVTGDIAFCVGHATLRFAHGDFAVSARFGQYDASIQHIDGRTQSTYASFLDEVAQGLMPVANSGEQRAKNVGSDTRVAGRPLGVYSFAHNAASLTFAHTGARPDLVSRAKLNVRLILVTPDQS